MSYLDDPEHMWEIDPGANWDLGEVVSVLLDHDPTVEQLALIWDGAAGLIARDAGTPAECVDTALIWLFG